MSRECVAVPPALQRIAERIVQIRALLADASPHSGRPVEEIAACLDLARDLLSAGYADRAVELLVALTDLVPDHDQAWQLLGFAFRDDQRMSEAEAAFARSRQLRPDDPLTVLSHAQVRHASGLPAADGFRRALLLAPGNPAAIRGYALALNAEGRGAAAQALLVDVLRGKPDWIDGQQCLAALRWTAGESQNFARGYRDACGAQPRNLALRLAWFRAVVQTRDWDAARAIIADGENLIGSAFEFTLARLFIASESGDRVVADQLFEQTATLRDPVRDIAFVRHCLRQSWPDRAEPVALNLLGTPSATSIWPYLSLIWRLRGDSRAQWLDGSETSFIRTFDLDVPPGDWDELAVALRRLHQSQLPILGQSVRGGTQTDGQIFFRPERSIQMIRTQVDARVREYIAALPGTEPGHPLLGPPRGGRVHFSGSWSVRLQGQGFHVSHTHPLGWISGALYLTLPDAAQLGAAPAGWICFGLAPPELDLALPAYRHVEPKPGRMVLFPSTMWHATLPFADGERMTMAFDVSAQRRAL